MYRAATIRCRCCDLDQDVSVDELDSQPRSTCARCETHRADTVEAFAARETDHVLMLRRGLTDAADHAHTARGERDFYRERLKREHAARELMAHVLARIDDIHHFRDDECACGAPDCRVVGLLADPRIARQIRFHDEERRTLRELRNANPESWTGNWDDIDVTLVYPRRSRPSPSGRHRAVG